MPTRKGSKKKRSSGKILRKGYTRKSKTGKKTTVKGKYIAKQGRPGVKGPKIITITELGLLGKFGYNTHKSKESRQKALDKAVNEYGELKVLHRVNAIRTLNKSHLATWKKLDSDVKYLQRKYFPDRKGSKKSTARPYTKKEMSTPRTRNEVRRAERRSKSKSKKKTRK